MSQENMSDNISPDEVHLLVGRLVVGHNHQLSSMEQKFQSMLEQSQKQLQHLMDKCSALDAEKSMLQQEIEELKKMSAGDKGVVGKAVGDKDEGQK